MTVLACERCGSENPAEARFCMGCGARLPRRCPSCGTAAPAQARFCMQCGATLDAAAGPAAAAPPEERRQVTVLFADLSGYTAMAEGMDPEAVKGLVDRALRRLTAEVERHGGTVDKYIGDNVMALFGAPVAHEDDAERAVRAGLAMQAAMRELGLTLRVGVNTGEVLAGALAEAGSYTVIGDTVNVAARLEAASRPGAVTVGERTFAATREAIAYRELAPLTLKGKSEPVPAWEATGPIAAQPVRRARVDRAPLVGRDAELELLEALYARVADERRPRLVTIFGEAGVGKSRLLAEFTRALAARPRAPKLRTGRCPPYGSGLAYWALGEVVRGEAGIVESDDAEVAWRKLATHVAGLGGEERTAALIARMLGVEAPGEHTVGDDPQRNRERFFSAIRWGFERATAQGPFVLAIEDIHWADDGMLDLIEDLVQRVQGPLLLVCLAREELLERRPGWGGGRSAGTSIFLQPLSDAATRELATALLGTEESAGLVAERSGGNPLFVEEMARLVAEGDGDAALPDTVQAVLAARLDSLGRFERRLVQHAAVAGRSFWEGWLAAGAEEEGGDLEAALASLQQKEIVIPWETDDGGLAQRSFAFRHVLIGDVAYGMLPKAVRARKHHAVARFVERQAGDRGDEVTGLLAEHYGRAAQIGAECGLAEDELAPMREQALRFLVAAADGAAALYSNREALAHYRTAREIAERAAAPEVAAVLATIQEKEGDVCLRMGRVDAALELWTAAMAHHRGQEDLPRMGDLHRKLGAGLWHKGDRAGAIEHYQRGISLLKDGPACLELVRLYEEAAFLYLHTGDNMLAVYASEKALRLAERLGETRAASRAHGIFGRVFGRIGDMAKARENLERSVELARESDPEGTVGALLALGRQLEISDADHDAARAAYEEALAIADRVGDLPAQVELHAQLGQLAAWRADWDAAAAATEASEALARREGLVGKLCFPLALRGLLAWRDGRWADAEAACREADELARQAGWSEVSFSALFTLAMAQRDGGDLTGAIATLDEALDLCERAGFVPQSIQAMAERALVLSLAGDRERAREAAGEAAHLAERLRYPAGRAAALEAGGLTAADPAESAAQLEQAAALWSDLGRPLERARCDLLAAHALRERGAEGWVERCERAAAALERLGLPALAARARAEAAAA